MALNPAKKVDRMKKTFLFLGVLVLAVVAASTFPLFSNSAEEKAVTAAEMEALAPITEVPPVAKTARQGGCGGSCCGPSGATGATAQKSEQIRLYLTDYYQKEMGGDIQVLVKDLGCHHEADVVQDGVVVARLSINGGVITRIG